MSEEPAVYEVGNPRAMFIGGKASELMGISKDAEWKEDTSFPPMKEVDVGRIYTECQTHGNQPLTETDMDWFKPQACLECYIESLEGQLARKIKEREQGGIEFIWHGADEPGKGWGSYQAKRDDFTDEQQPSAAHSPPQPE